jgi:hypothetical protein
MTNDKIPSTKLIQMTNSKTKVLSFVLCAHFEFCALVFEFEEVI